MIQLQDIGKLYPSGRTTVSALDDISLTVRGEEFVVLHGPSGSGKTTLLLIAGAMLHPTTGRAQVLGQDLYTLGARARAAFRAAHIGFVFQMYCLLPYLDVRENVLLAANDRRARQRGAELLAELDMEQRLHHLPAELSAGERQRVACARALVNQPQIILADEPTGNLDEENSLRIHRLLAAFCARGGAVLMVTHGGGAARFAHRTLQLREGRIVAQEAPSKEE